MLVISDTHGYVSGLKAVFTWAKDRLPPNDSIYRAAFLGDGVSDLRPAADAAGFYSDWKYVRGNNDYDHSIPDSAVFDFAGHRFFLCHGHKHSLYSGFHALVNAGHSNGADVVLFGHTHIPFCKEMSGILLVNPGSASRPRGRTGPTFAVIECAPDETPTAEFWEISRSGIEKLKARPR